MVIKIKRGTTKPTTSNISSVGELAFDTKSESLYIRGNSKMIKIGLLEQVFFYEGSVSNYRLNYTFDKNYIYKLHVVCSTNKSDLSDTTINYYTSSSSSSKLSGTFTNVYTKDNSSSVLVSNSKNITDFIVKDAYSNSSAIKYATTKVIDLEISPTQETSITSTYSWLVHGYSTCCGSDQSDTGLTQVTFTHVIDGAIGSILINPGLDLGTSKTMVVSLFRVQRR